MIEETKVPRKLLVITAHFPPTKSPEADHALCLCENLVRRGFQIDVLTNRANLSNYNGIRIHPVMRDWSWTDLPRLVRFLRRCSPNMVLLIYMGWIYNFHPMVTYAATIVKRVLADVTFVTQFENAGGSDPSTTSLLARAIRKALAKWVCPGNVDYSFGTLLRDSDRMIALSHQQRTILAGYYPAVNHKFVVIPPPPLIPIDSTPNALVRTLVRKNLGIAADEILLVYFGYIYPGKGIETLLQAFHKLNSIGRRFRVVLVGGTLVNHSNFTTGLSPSAYLQKLIDLAKELGIAERMTLTGEYASDSYVASRHLQAADICVLPFDSGAHLSHSSLSAAMAHGLPIITTQGPLTEPLFSHEHNVFLCPPKDPDALAEAIETLMDRPELRQRLSKGARELAQEWFSWEKAVQRTVGTLTCATT